MSIAPQDIPALFSLLHDGEISAYESTSGTLSLKITIPYLAELVDPRFTAFAVTLHDVRQLAFHTWPVEQSAEPEVLTTAAQIFAAELDILSAQLEDGAAVVACAQLSPDYPYSGGMLVIAAASASVSDESGAPYSIAALATLANRYWHGNT